MSWLSLAANRYELRAGLRRNLEDADHQALRYEVVSALLGIHALLVADDFYIEREVERAQALLQNFREHIHPPNPALMGDVLSLAIIAGLGGADATDVIRSIATAKIYTTRRDKTLQLLARRILGLDKTPSKPYGKRGHVTTEAQWYHVVERVTPADGFNLAVTLEHDLISLFRRYILPLGYLLAQTEAESDWRIYLRQLMAWGSPIPKNKKEIVYERTATVPRAEVALDPDDKSTWRGFDALELRGDDLVAYYYLGVNWEAPLFFDAKMNIYSFLDNVEFDWRLVKEVVSVELWQRIDAARALREHCAYVVVYDASVASAPEDDLRRAVEHYGVNLITKDVTEV